MYFILAGIAHLRRAHIDLGTIGRGDHLGELALIARRLPEMIDSVGLLAQPFRREWVARRRPPPPPRVREFIGGSGFEY